MARRECPCTSSSWTRGVSGLLALRPSADQIRAGTHLIVARHVNIARCRRRWGTQALAVGGDTVPPNAAATARVGYPKRTLDRTQNTHGAPKAG